MDFALKSQPKRSALNPRGDRALVADQDEVVLWRTEGNLPEKLHSLPARSVVGIGWSADGQYFLVQRGDSISVSVFDAESYAVIVEVPNASLFDVTTVAGSTSFNSPDGKYLLGNDAKSRLRRWVFGP